MTDARHQKDATSKWLNWSSLTLLYTFVLGVVTGTIYAIACGEVSLPDFTRQGNVLTVYLSIVGALFAAALGWFGNRATDSLLDRRQRRRGANLALMRIRHLAYQLSQLEQLLAPYVARPEQPMPANFPAVFGARATSIGMAASTVPEFDTLVEDDDDIYQVVSVTSTFLALQASFPSKLENDDDARELLTYALHPKGIRGLRRQFKALQQANQYFVRYRMG